MRYQYPHDPDYDHNEFFLEVPQSKLNKLKLSFFVFGFCSGCAVTVAIPALILWIINII